MTDALYLRHGLPSVFPRRRVHAAPDTGRRALGMLRTTDTFAPHISVTSDGSASREQSFLIQGYVLDNVGVTQIAVDGKAIPIQPGSDKLARFQFQTMLSTPTGKYTITARDAAGNEGTLVLPVSVDPVKPTLKITASNAAAAWCASRHRHRQQPRDADPGGRQPPEHHARQQRGLLRRNDRHLGRHRRHGRRRQHRHPARPLTRSPQWARGPSSSGRMTLPRGGAGSLCPMHDLTALILSASYFGILAIVFAETGLLVGFFLPGDSLLLAAGVLAADGDLNLGASWSP